MKEQSGQRDRSIAIIVIVAGLLTGAIITHQFLAPDAPSERRGQYRMAEEHRIPYDELVEMREQAAAAEEDAVESDDLGSEGAEEAAEAPRRHSTAAERKAIHEARERMRAEGVEEFAELTEELFVQISARMVVMAAALENHPEAADPVAMQGLMGDYAAGVLAAERIDPDDFYDFTYRVHADRKLSEEIGEKILREAEKHTTRRIDVSTVPGIEALPVPEE